MVFYSLEFSDTKKQRKKEFSLVQLPVAGARLLNVEIQA